MNTDILFPGDIEPEVVAPNEYTFTFNLCARDWSVLTVENFSGHTLTQQKMEELKPKVVCNHVLHTATGKFVDKGLHANITYKTTTGERKLWEQDPGVSWGQSPLYVNNNGYWELTKPGSENIRWCLIFQPGKECILVKNTDENAYSPYEWKSMDMSGQFTIQLAKKERGSEVVFQQWCYGDNPQGKLVDAETKFTPDEVRAFEAFCQMFVEKGLIPKKLPKKL